MIAAWPVGRAGWRDTETAVGQVFKFDALFPPDRFERRRASRLHAALFKVVKRSLSRTDAKTELTQLPSADHGAPQLNLGCKGIHFTIPGERSLVAKP